MEDPLLRTTLGKVYDGLKTAERAAYNAVKYHRTHLEAAQERLDEAAMQIEAMDVAAEKLGYVAGDYT